MTAEGKTGYSSYIYKVLKQVHPDADSFKRGMSIMESFNNDVCDFSAATTRRTFASGSSSSTLAWCAAVATQVCRAVALHTLGVGSGVFPVGRAICV
eukprot:8210-Heterococcus_DN1.PRE.2